MSVSGSNKEGWALLLLIVLVCTARDVLGVDNGLRSGLDSPQSTDKANSGRIRILRSAESGQLSQLSMQIYCLHLYFAALRFELTHGLGFALGTGTYNSKRRPCLRKSLCNSLCFCLKVMMNICIAA